MYTNRQGGEDGGVVQFEDAAVARSILSQAVSFFSTTQAAAVLHSNTPQSEISERLCPHGRCVRLQYDLKESSAPPNSIPELLYVSRMGRDTTEADILEAFRVSHTYSMPIGAWHADSYMHSDGLLLLSLFSLSACVVACRLHGDVVCIAVGCSCRHDIRDA